MSRVTTTICNCGCGEKTDNPNNGWFVLSQNRKKYSSLNTSAKISRDLHFSSLSCLEKWVRTATTILPFLQKMAEGLDPRGGISGRDGPEGLFV
jgi:hypothetical protein